MWLLCIIVWCFRIESYARLSLNRINTALVWSNDGGALDGSTRNCGIVSLSGCNAAALWRRILYRHFNA
ncbi:hypothetical protein PF005_g1733 [Phytophthora fragariae]|uniref:Secreted protein n=1 Tax=Phytophthora fragariae TaxID=53985 RepID=A0A6A3TU99_9STRA|nr:hypothetical protein PF003_g34210 [Phytophthora fragariae]KAE8947404.1 hypothetical protein PF009_g2979 [Phytophthora fragariae]KAE9004887.1 hypothetical protein PF011_g12271 [Phytophthora fragariae]KAE9127533.1 hypothetical protein PF010_g4847 [Phytophthora fragariae]KAE9137119.1 hypothetical protein PF007_g1929 [Phytophthora fragariae]